MSIISATTRARRSSLIARCIVRHVRTVRLFFLCALLAPLFFFPSSLWAQDETEWSKQLDTIVLTSGRRLAVKVASVTPQNVFYTTEDSDEEFSFERRNVYRVIYASGRTELMAEKAIESIDEFDWRAVILYENPDDVHGLYSHGMIFAESGRGSKTLRAAQRSAESKLQKRASQKKAIAVLIHKRSTSGGYGEVPTYRIDGEAFGTEPLDENFVDEGEVTQKKTTKEKKSKGRRKKK